MRSTARRTPRIRTRRTPRTLSPQNAPLRSADADDLIHILTPHAQLSIHEIKISPPNATTKAIGPPSQKEGGTRQPHKTANHRFLQHLVPKLSRITKKRQDQEQPDQIHPRGRQAQTRVAHFSDKGHGAAIRLSRAAERSAVQQVQAEAAGEESAAGPAGATEAGAGLAGRHGGGHCPGGPGDRAQKGPEVTRIRTQLPENPVR
jgi:hypothetical protein